MGFHEQKLSLAFKHGAFGESVVYFAVSSILRRYLQEESTSLY